MEMAIALDPLIEQVLVVGEGKPYLAALLVVNADLWEGLAREFGLDPEQPQSLDDAALQQVFIQRIRSALKDFPGYAKIRRVALLLEPWSVENGLLTPTLKVKRPKVLERYAEQMAALYSSEH